MDPAPTNLSPAVAAGLETWHRCVAQRNLSAMSALLHPEAMLRSPMAFKPYSPAPAVLLVLNTVLQVFEDFTYHRQLASGDGLNLVLEFSARVGDKQLKGIDMLRFDEQGKIRELEVMVRPFSALQALGEEMGRRIGHLLPAYKARTG
jgi:hypothetical protein